MLRAETRAYPSPPMRLIHSTCPPFLPLQLSPLKMGYQPFFQSCCHLREARPHAAPLQHPHLPSIIASHCSPIPATTVSQRFPRRTFGIQRAPFRNRTSTILLRNQDVYPSLRLISLVKPGIWNYERTCGGVYPQTRQTSDLDRQAERSKLTGIRHTVVQTLTGRMLAIVAAGPLPETASGRIRVPMSKNMHHPRCDIQRSAPLLPNLQPEKVCCSDQHSNAQSLQHYRRMGRKITRCKEYQLE